ncbi:hypothetical protein COX59_04015 [Candidatus Beckwithbacteria bacterium CG_4_10_14_0_2_um_filter_47_25]|uniref:HicB-like antitoxin of toxin-antitoxin system domain-containing protein n=1 Tax=Candidatus Beckwithbacteria bacterium CG_4_10_14_0_2_um_filter_47_25 TaxID=1974493 RepID=A0A2M7W5L1_9BACT|nr:MAG: hypothetical protein COX59_04015 [Candidatus Beckwithbacteria bacterium CG_4_10_14_0_2_um_filter_47_25]
MKKQTVLDYRVILKSDRRIGTDEPCYVAECPTLGLADDGNTPAEALENIQKTIKFHLECLQQEHQEIPIDKPHSEFTTTTQISFSPDRYTQYAY